MEELDAVSVSGKVVADVVGPFNVEGVCDGEVLGVEGGCFARPLRPSEDIAAWLSADGVQVGHGLVEDVSRVKVVPIINIDEDLIVGVARDRIKF
jgi:hypothetical protein